MPLRRTPKGIHWVLVHLQSPVDILVKFGYRTSFIPSRNGWKTDVWRQAKLAGLGRRCPSSRQNPQMHQNPPADHYRLYQPLRALPTFRAEPVFRPPDFFLLRWVRRNYRRFQSARMKTRRWLERVRARQPLLFSHWVLEGRLNNGSRMNGDVHVWF